MTFFRSMVLGALAALGLAGGALAAPACDASFLNGVAPALVGGQTDKTQQVCFSFFVVLDSYDKLTPLWSAEHLTQAEAKGGDSIGRKNTFHPEPQLPAGSRAELADYKGVAGVYDRGHMTPADDAIDFTAQNETFTLANMVPQASYLNQHLWQYIEGSLHVLAEQDGELFIVTGPIFSASPKQLHNRVSIPDYTFKAVYDPKSGKAIGFVATNVAQPVCWVLSIQALATMSGVDPFPNLDAATKQDATPWVLPHGSNNRPLPDCKPKT